MPAYPSDLTDQEWEIIKKEVPKERRGGRHRSVSSRDILTLCASFPLTEELDRQVSQA
jgi:hypothetical protein